MFPSKTEVLDHVGNNYRHMLVLIMVTTPWGRVLSEDLKKKKIRVTTLTGNLFQVEGLGSYIYIFDSKNMYNFLFVLFCVNLENVAVFAFHANAV